MITFSTKRPLFWIIFVSISILAGIVSYIYFPKAFDIINIDLKMDRSDAIKAAKLLAEQHKWEPEQYHQAANFDVNDIVKTYVELEAGGVRAFTKILEEKFYSPYLWTIRHFQEQAIHEAFIHFTPEGNPYGFELIIPENEQGLALTSQEAQKIAEENLAAWSITINDFDLVEQSQSTMPSGRIDHTFVYEAKHKKVGDAFYRLTLMVSGNKRSKVSLDLKVPEAFERRYEEMRSYNKTLAQFANIIMIILYFFGGALLGILFLLRRHALLWQHALGWAAFLALLQLFAYINRFPLFWMSYHTALSRYTFLSRQLLSGITIFLFYLIIGFIIILAAEGLSRLAFGNQLQLWRIWSRQGASSLQVLGRTLGGYLMPTIDLVYVIVFYVIMFTYFRWWYPSETLYDPNIVAQYLPWLSPVAHALSAGFLEECLFRAIPLSCAALLGQRIGKRNLLIGIVFVAQAFIFGAAHANYPAQPFYARLIELILPSCWFAGIFLQFGLVPAILSHFLYDVILMSLPIFAATSSDFLLDKIMVILCSSIPLLIIIIAGLRARGWHNIAEHFYNRFWQPATMQHPEEEFFEEPIVVTHQPYSVKQLLLFCLIGCSIILFGLFNTATNRVTIPLTMTRNQAIEHAKKFLHKSIPTATQWQPLSRIEDPFSKFSTESDHNQLIFVWRTNQDLFKPLMGSYLRSPYWLVRFVQFTGDVAQRAEEIQVQLFNDGQLLQTKHILPEDQQLPSLSEQEAITLLEHTITKQYTEPFYEISAVSQKHPNRKDWVFTFSTTTQLPEGQQRLSATVSGDQISNIHRFVYVPEAWTRAFNHEEAINEIITMFGSYIAAFLLVLLLFLCFKRLRQKKYSMHAAALFFGIFIIRSVIQIINMWQQNTSYFSTAQPFLHQAFNLLSGITISTVFEGAIYALIAGFIWLQKPRTPQLYKSTTAQLLVGIFQGCLAAIIYSSYKKLAPSLQPPWPELTTAGQIIPGISDALYYFKYFLQATLGIQLIVICLDYISRNWKEYTWLLTAIIVTIVLVHLPLVVIWYWLLAGIIAGLAIVYIYKEITRFAYISIPYAVATFFSWQAIASSVSGAYPGVWLAGITTSLLLALAAWIWVRRHTTR